MEEKPLEEYVAEIDALKKRVAFLELQNAAMDEVTLISRIDRNGIILDVNDHFCQVSGFSRDDLVGKEFSIGRREAADEEKMGEIREAMEKGEAWNGEHWELTKDGKVEWFDLHVVPIGESSQTDHQFLVVRTDITQRIEFEEKLLERNNELNTFIYKLSHDIRGPVASVLGLLHLAGEEITNLTALRYLAMIRQRINRLDGVLRDLVETISVTERELVAETIDFNKLVDSVVSELDPEQDLQMEYRTAFGDAAEFVNDARILRPVFHHLIGNAIRYRDPSKDNSFIDIRVGRMNGGINIDIADNGIGMPPEVRDRVFEMFYRGNLQSSGAGLGLYIVKVAVEKLGGKASIDSTLGEGSKVTIFLPSLDPAHS